MKIKVDLKIFLILIFYILTRNIRIFALTTIFIFIHELGHVLAGIALGLKISKVNITMLGFSIEFENYGAERKINRILIDIAGPVINFIALIIAIIFNQEELSYINLVIIVVNMLPIYPLDGGRLLKTILLYKKSYKDTMRKIERISKNTLIAITFISSILVLYFKNMAFFVLIIYLWYLLLIEKKKNKIIRRVFRIIEKNT